MNNTFCKNCHRIPSQCCCTPAKTLTDEEIQQIWLEFDARNTNDWFIAIARAILKKAQEK
jgi:hypothetical protein